METELMVLLAAAIGLSAYAVVGQYLRMRVVGIREVRWRSKSALLGLILSAFFFVIVAVIVLMQKTDPAYMIILAALVPMYAYRPVSYETIGDSGLLLHQGKSSIRWTQVREWSLMDQGGRWVVQIRYTSPKGGLLPLSIELDVPDAHRNAVEMSFRNHAATAVSSSDHSHDEGRVHR